MFIEVKMNGKKRTHRLGSFLSLRLDNQISVSKDLAEILAPGERFNILYDHSAGIIRLIENPKGFLLSTYVRSGSSTLAGGGVALLRNGATTGRYFLVPGSKYDFKKEDEANV